MNDEEKKQITGLRRDGLGYGLIAQVLGMKENTVKTFCRRNGLTGKAGKKENEIFPGVMLKTCKQCGSRFLQYPGHREKLFCSADCRIKWWNTHLSQVKRKAMYDYICPVCGKQFSAYGNRNRKYCSRDCYITARFGGAS